MKNLGSASITIELHQGNITISHTDGTILRYIKSDDLVENAWEQMWECLDSLENE